MLADRKKLLLLKRASGMLNLPGLMARPPRVQYGALPWRIADGTLEVLLLTSRGTGRWVIPKGWPHESMSAAQSAAQEAFEEAGIKGRVTRDAIGTYRYDKLRDGGAAVECVVYVHALHVTRQLDDWPEKGQRDMQWFARATAAEHVQEPELRDLILSYAPSLPYA